MSLLDPSYAFMNLFFHYYSLWIFTEAWQNYYTWLPALLQWMVDHMQMMRDSVLNQLLAWLFCIWVCNMLSVTMQVSYYDKRRIIGELSWCCSHCYMITNVNKYIHSTHKQRDILVGPWECVIVKRISSTCLISPFLAQYFVKTSLNCLFLISIVLYAGGDSDKLSSVAQAHYASCTQLESLEPAVKETVGLHIQWHPV